jgi:RHS repeat-associated protein
VGTINATTRFAYDIGNMVSSITDPNNNTSNIGYRGEYFWATAGDTEGWTGIGNSTVSQSTEQKFRGTGSLRVNVNTGDPSTSVGAKRTFDPPVAWNSLQQEVLGFVYLPTGSQVDAQLGLTTVDGSSYAGSFIRVAGGQWTALRMPYAQISPAFKIKELRLAISTTSNGSPVYNGPIWLDQVMVKGIARSLTDAKPAKNTLSVYRYDWLNRLTYVAQPDQNGIERNTVYEYANFGEVTKVTDPLGNSTSASYDAELRLTTMQEPNGATTRLSYYPNSNEVQTTTNPTGEMRRQGVNTATGDLRYTLDERNEQRRTDNQDFVAMIYVRDGVGNVTSMQTNRYAAGTNLEQSPLPAPLGTLREIKYTYGAGGVVTSMTDPNGNTTNFTYDTNTGYRTGSDAPAGNGETSRRFTTSTYNPDGSVQRITDPKGQIITLEYDGLGRLIKANYGVDTASAFSTTFTLDRNGNTTAMSDNSGTSSWAYDANNALTNEVRTQNGATRTANSTYFANGLLQSRSTLSGQTVNYSYDVGNRPLTQTDPNDGGRAITYGYDSDGRLATKTFPSGVSQRLVYDLAGLVDLITLQRGDGTVLQRFDYDYGIDANGTRAPEYWNGNVLSVTELDGSKVTYRYDDLDRLASAVRTGSAPFNQQFGYDRNSNRTSVISEGTTTNAAYDAANQVMSYGATTYAYDRNGNQVRSGSDQMTYDVANRWTSGTVNGQTVASSYDGRGQRVSKTVAGARTDFWYDQTGLTQETGANTATYLRDMGGTLLSTNTGGTTYNYGQDRLGSITALAGTDGTLVNSYTYTPYGFLQASTGSVPNPFRFAGTYQDSGAYYQMGARYYHQPTGRFTQQDPLPCTNNGGQPYTYANADPANSADPDGLCYWRQSYRQVWGFVPYVYWGCRGVCSSPAAFARRFPYIMRTEWQVRAIVCHDYCLPRSWGSYSVPVFQLVCGSFVVREIVGLACHPTDWRCMLGR